MFVALLVVTGIFVGLLVVHRVAGFRPCAICGGVTGTWLLLLGLYHGGLYENPVAIALFMGQTIVGGGYLIRDRVPRRFVIFALPFVGTATAGGYALITLSVSGGVVVVLGVLWIVTGGLDAYRHHDRVRSTVDTMVACCRDW